MNILDPSDDTFATYIVSNLESLQGPLARVSEPDARTAHFHCMDWKTNEQYRNPFTNQLNPDYEYLSYMYVHNY